MCGIAAVLGNSARVDAVERMLLALAHRGPDDVGATPVRDAGGDARGVLGHRRLAIIDLSPSGHQPMWTADEMLGIVFNGEIYNYRALRDDLRRQGEVFESDSDTEVLLKGWRRHGASFVDRLRGMFAFVVWDRARSTATLVRDPFGIKPLYLAEVAGQVLVASELRALIAGGLAPRLSTLATAGYLATGSVSEPETAIEGARALPAGSFVEIAVTHAGVAVAAPRNSQSRPWWTQDSPMERDAERAAQRVRDALMRSVERHLVSDVPVACFLSGGIDSSAVVALASKIAGAGLDTFTVTFDEAEFDESVQARAVARRFGTRHHEVPLSAHDLLAALPLAFAAMDQPSLDGLNTFLVSRAVREAGIKVVLSGLGGDEMFAGYPSFHRARRAALLWRAPLGFRRLGARAFTHGTGVRPQKLALLLDAASPAAGAYHSARALFAGPMLHDLLGSHGSLAAAPSPIPDGLSTLQSVTWLETSMYMRNTLLRDSDVFSMAQGLELRVPFVDVDVATAAAGIDDGLRISPRMSKPVLVNAVKDLLPREVWDRPKRGFTLPFANWMQRELRGDVAAALTTEQRIQRLGLDPVAVRSVWTRFLSGAGVSWSRPWALYTLVRWAETLGVTAETPVMLPRPRTRATA